ncbi:hypothetical protein T4D_5541 [Trichinella pseudospiralis]|uniref:Uncharacterized protein n=1 Tax=Trichinella pseudospiralis TaxID=6337 RepID=A0A0V1FUW8_TRIPS|nr:hypothetical protein T4D_5541 [Trichinella pseudospiralis]
MHFIPMVNKRSSQRSLGLRGQNRLLEEVLSGEERRKEDLEEYEEKKGRILYGNHTGKSEK